MNIKKTFTAVALGAVITVCSLPFAACGGGYSETYAGTVSETTFTTKDDAVKGYLEEEISGKTTEAVLVNYTVDKELSEGEIAGMAIGDNYKEGLKKVEEISVEYKEESESSYAAVAYDATEESKTIIRTIYLLTYTDMFRFFTPAIKDGESLSASYYDSTFEAEKYINCTMNATLTNSQIIRNKTVIRTQTALAKATKYTLYELDEIHYEGLPDEETAGNNNSELYICETANGLYGVYVADDKVDGPIPHKYCKTVNEYFMQWFNNRFGSLDHTFFKKTDTGYALREDKFAEFLKSQYGSDFYLSDDNTSSFEYVINIADGRMADVKMSVKYNGNEDSMTIKFSDFGNTVITIPDKVKAVLPE